jgi:hypothetical protein
MKPGADFQAYLAKREALFRNPTLEGATALMVDAGVSVDLGALERPDVPLAALHKARLQWLGATDAMLAESIGWLTMRGYQTSSRGAPPLRPERRDKQRAARGLAPLKADPFTVGIQPPTAKGRSTRN